MIFLVLGILIGIFLAFIAVAFGTRRERDVIRTLKKLGDVINPPKKVEFFAPIESEAEAIADVIKENDKRGEDTELKDL